MAVAIHAGRAREEKERRPQLRLVFGFALWQQREVPTIFENKNGFRYFFVSLDRGEPMHIHVGQGRKYAKFWLEPVELAKSRNLRSHELAEIRKTIEENLNEIRSRWREHFGWEN